MSTRKAVVVPVVLLLVIVGGYLSITKLLPIYVTYDYIQTLPEYNEPAAFVINYDPSDKETTELQRQCKTGFFYCKEQNIISPLYPHKELKTTYLSTAICQYQYENGKRINLSTEGRNMHVDPFWHVFWIEIDRCGEKTRFFGPYRSSI